MARIAGPSRCAREPTDAPRSGDGLKLPDEECDDGNLSSGDGCPSKCTLEANWDCHHVSDANGDTLVVRVARLHAPRRRRGDAGALGPYCGDGMVEPEKETCNDGRNASTYNKSGCAAGCKDAPRCGDGRVDSLWAETCDDGNTTAQDGCGADCRFEIQ